MQGREVGHPISEMVNWCGINISVYRSLYNLLHYVKLISLFTDLSTISCRIIFHETFVCCHRVTILWENSSRPRVLCILQFQISGRWCGSRSVRWSSCCQISPRQERYQFLHFFSNGTLTICFVLFTHLIHSFSHSLTHSYSFRFYFRVYKKQLDIKYAYQAQRKSNNYKQAFSPKSLSVVKSRMILLTTQIQGSVLTKVFMNGQQNEDVVNGTDTNKHFHQSLSVDKSEDIVNNTNHMILDDLTPTWRRYNGGQNDCRFRKTGFEEWDEKQNKYTSSISINNNHDDNNNNVHINSLNTRLKQIK